MTKYEAAIIEIGVMVDELLRQGILILFDKTAPPELQEISVVHTGASLEEDVEVGDLIVLGDFSYKVTAVGEIANRNLRNIGHACLKFDGRNLPELPGDIHLYGDELPFSLKKGDIIIIKDEKK